MNGKPWWKSRTIWLNVFALVVSALADNWSTLQPVLPAHFYAWVAFVLPVFNVMIRAITTQALTLGRGRVDMGAGGKV